MNIDLFKIEVEKLGIKLDQDKLDKLNLYADYLIEYNNHTNLTAIKDLESIYLKHFYDSLTIFKVDNIVNFNKTNNLLDVGCGAGFPGMVIAIIQPNIEVTLLDSNNKKITFLNNLINKLNINNVKTVNERSEDFAHLNLDKYDIVTSRAVAALPILSELALPLVKVGGYFIPLKANAQNEINSAKKIIDKLNGKIVDKVEFNLPIEDSLRTIIVIKKVDVTPNGYPRNYNKIKEN